MITNLRLSLARRLIQRRSIRIAAIAASSAVMLLGSGQAPAAAFTRALNPQPLPPGLYAPGHPRPTVNGPVTPPPGHFARRACVAWGRVCVKAGQGTRTHPAPCQQYMYVCRKYG